MSKVITFSTTFPSYHPRKGEPTYFVEKLWSGWADMGMVMDNVDFKDLPFDFDKYYQGKPKWHTIRAGHRWRVGDKFSPRVWSGKPYNSKQIIIAPDTEIVKVWDFRMFWADEIMISLNKVTASDYDHRKIAENDGLDIMDFYYWFRTDKIRTTPFDGQIICWNNEINY